MSAPQKTWWSGTRLDLSSLGEKHIHALSQLASSQEHFISKYVNPPNTDLLQQDVQIALGTTPEYALDFATRVIDYFKSTIQQSPPEEVEASSDVASPTEFTQAINVVQQSSDKFAEDKAKELNTYITQELTTLRDEIQNVLQQQEQLETNFSQMRAYLDQLIQQRPVEQQPPMQQPLPQMTVAPPSHSHVNSLLQGLSFAIDQENSDVVTIQDVLDPLPGSATNQQVPIKTIRWMKKKKIDVIFNHIILDDIYTVQIRPDIPQSGLFSSANHLRFGFLIDDAINNRGDPANIMVSYKTDGQLQVAKQIEKTEKWKPKDTIRFYVSMRKHTCIIFINNKPLPFLIVNVPPVIKFFVRSEGVGTHVDVLEFATRAREEDFSDFQTDSWKKIPVLPPPHH